MKANRIISIFLLCVLLYSCGNVDWKKIFPRNTFDKPFPKDNKDLTELLGSHLVIYMHDTDKDKGDDTLHITIQVKNNLNLITLDKSKDTVFYGTVSKYRGLYFLNQKITDTAYWIFAMKKTGDSLYGLNGMLLEELRMDREALSGNYKGLVMKINKDSSAIRLHTDKKLILEMLAPYVDSLKPYHILSTNLPHDSMPLRDSAKTIAAIDSDEFALVSSIFPNPTYDEVNFKLRDKNRIFFTLTDKKDKVLLNADFSDSLNTVDLSEFPAGIYKFNFASEDGRTVEWVKVVKRASIK